jgi:hypothetical protein
MGDATAATTGQGEAWIELMVRGYVADLVRHARDS